MLCIFYHNKKVTLAVVVCGCNPSYEGSGDWEDHGLRPAW
jgi:hypothetical protein